MRFPPVFAVGWQLVARYPSTLQTEIDSAVMCVRRKFMSNLCLHCAAPIPNEATFCPGCGQPIAKALSAHGIVGVFPENIAGALAYLTFIPAVVFLLISPYNRSRFVRFHSLQCLSLWVAMTVIGVALKFAGLILLIIPVLGHLLVILVSMVAVLAAFLVWLVLVIKALQGEAFKVPFLGELAQRHAVAV